MWEGIIRNLIVAFGVSVLAAVVLAALAPLGWPFEVVASFHVHLAALVLVAAFAAALVRSRLTVLLLLAAALQVSFGVSALLANGEASVDAQAEVAAPLRIVSANVLYRNDGYGRTLEFVAEQDPDIFVVLEETSRWKSALEESLAQQYPYRLHAEPSASVRGASGVGMYSKVPLQRVSLDVMAGEERPALLAYADLGTQRLLVAGVHPWTPETPARFAKRGGQLADVAAFIAAQGEEAVLVGDLNLTPYSPVFTRVLQEGSLRSAATGFGWQASWPAHLGLFGIPIDHALLTGGVVVQSFRVGENIGSDHRPLVLDIGIEGALR